MATALLQGLEPGDHIVAPADVYFGLRQVIGGVFAKWPLETTYVDMTDLAAVKAAMRPNTRLVLIETPSNPLLQITDLAAVARIARAANAITVCDGTFTTPVLQHTGGLGFVVPQGYDFIQNARLRSRLAGYRFLAAGELRFHIIAA